MPPVPPTAVVLTTENGLHRIPPCRSDFTRPWFLYDYVDPAAKFRRQGSDDDWADQDYVEMGDDLGALVDEPEEDTKPVLSHDYQCVYMGHTDPLAF